MIFFLLIHAEVQVIDGKFQELQDKEEEINHAITGKEKTVKIMKNLKLMPKSTCPPRYRGAKICISQGGCPPSNDTAAADMRQIHDEIQQPDRPLTVTCGHSHDVFESPHLRDPGQERMG